VNKAGFDLNVSLFFFCFLMNKSTQYIWNNFMSMPFRTSVEVGQRSALSLVLSALYISPIFHIFEKRINNLLISIPVSLLSFINNGLLINLV